MSTLGWVALFGTVAAGGVLAVYLATREDPTMAKGLSTSELASLGITGTGPLVSSGGLLLPADSPQATTLTSSASSADTGLLEGIPIVGDVGNVVESLPVVGDLFGWLL
jgi:hypothetical protein